MVVNVEALTCRAVTVQLHHKPACIPSHLYVPTRCVDDLRYAVDGRYHHALFDVGLVVALRDKLDNVGVLGELVTYVVDNLIHIHAGLVLWAQLRIVAPRVPLALHKVEEVSKDEYPRSQLSRLLKVSV
jgi:hypothetical protein